MFVQECVRARPRAHTRAPQGTLWGPQEHPKSALGTLQGPQEHPGDPRSTPKALQEDPRPAQERAKTNPKRGENLIHGTPDDEMWMPLPHTRAA